MNLYFCELVLSAEYIRHLQSSKFVFMMALSKPACMTSTILLGTCLTKFQNLQTQIDRTSEVDNVKC